MFTTLTKAAVATTLGAVMLLGGTVAATAAEPTSEPTTTADECSFGQHLLHAWLRLPADLRGDLSAIRDLPADERPEAVREIREDALEGRYGEGVEAGAQRIKERRLAAWATMPVELKADLIELRKAAPGERRELAEVIAQNALDGEYGDKAQATAERVRDSEFWQTCVAD
jgi:hypothetical protein